MIDADAIIKRQLLKAICAMEMDVKRLSFQLQNLKRLINQEGISIEELDLSVRTYNALSRAGITTIQRLLALMSLGPEEILGIRNFGEGSLNEVIDALNKKGFLENTVADADE
jgi:DNA-directed RNA polymerase alpha subunit